MTRRLSKAEREAEAERVRAALPLQPSEQVRADFMAEEYENVRSVFRSEYLVDEAGNKVRDENGKCVKAVGVVCGRCRAKSFFPYASLKGEYMNLCAAGWGGSPQDDYGFFDEREKITLFSDRLFHCPFCGRQTTVYAYARMKYQSTAVKSRYAQEIRNVLGHVVVIEWKLHKTIDREGEEFFSWENTGASFQVDGRMFRATGFEQWGLSRWEIDGWRLNVGGFKEGIGGVAKRLTYWEPDELRGAVEANEGLFNYLRYGNPERHVMAERYLDLWTKAPVIENMMNTYPKYTEGLISNKKYNMTIYVYARQFLNLKKAKPHEILGMEKEEANRIVAISPGPNFVKLYALCRQKKIDPKLMMKMSEEAARYTLMFFDEKVVKELNPPMARVLNYSNNKTVLLDILKDYWNMCQQVEGRVDESVMFPKNLLVAHDRIMERFNAEKDRIQNEGIKANAEKMRKYAFSDPETGLCIRPARSVAELIMEGKMLHHCVASYANAVAEGKTMIFFIRRQTEKTIPFYTLEYKNGAVIQNRGNKNCERTPEVIAFEAKWLQFIQKGFVKHGKRTAKAGA